MKTFRMILGPVAAVCAFGALASPALAKHKEHPHVLGQFVASEPKGAPIPETGISVSGVGYVENIELAGGSFILGPGHEEKECKKVTSAGLVTSSRSETLYQDIRFQGCYGIIIYGEPKKGYEVRQEVKIPKFHIPIEFHSNGYVETGEGEEASAKIEKAAISFKLAKGALCKVVLPAQTIPVKAVKKPYNEYEAASYETEPLEAKMKKFPSGFRETVDIDLELKKVQSTVETTSPACHLPAGLKDTNGVIEMELEEVGNKNANLGFRDKEEVEAEEA